MKVCMTTFSAQPNIIGAGETLGTLRAKASAA